MMKQYRVIGNKSEHEFAIGEIVTHVSHDKFSNGHHYWHMEWDEVEKIKKEKTMKLKLKAGKYYKTRDGRVVGPMKDCHYGKNYLFYKFYCNGYGSFGINGISIDGQESPDDLITRCHKPASKKKLMRVIQDLLLDAVYDEARNDSCIRAVKSAKKALKEGQTC